MFMMSEPDVYSNTEITPKNVPCQNDTQWNSNENTKVFKMWP